MSGLGRRDWRAGLKDILPSPVVRLLRRIVPPRTGFLGDYPTWAQAVADSTGYDQAAILAKVRGACLEVKSGRAVHERDGVLFPRIEYSWPLLAGLLLAAARSGGRLHVLDFGGSLGTTYLQNRRFLAQLAEVSWSVVEQLHYVEVGRREFADDRLDFFPDVDACLAVRHPTVLLTSGVLPYLERPFAVLDGILRHRFPWILIDRTTFSKCGRQRLVVQRIPASITGASYPCWLFARDGFTGYFAARGYTCVESFFEYEDYGDDVSSQGFIYAAQV